jgi:hypothetical protein
VHDRQQVLDEFLLRGQRLLIGDHDLAPMFGGQPFDQLEPIPRNRSRCATTIVDTSPAIT